MSINVRRFINRETGHFSVEVLTPMFLGGADGNGELRSPPFKNALRYWWRLTQGDTPADQLLAREQALFGGVHEDNNIKPEMKACRSLVDVVVTGAVKRATQGSSAKLGSKKNSEAGGKSVSLAAYLGMGPVQFKGNNGNYEKYPILPGERFSLSITWPNEHSDQIMDTISLFSHFGALGSRSRNGWGSIDISSPSVELRSIRSLHEKYGEEISRVFTSSKKYPFKLAMNRGARHSALLWEIASENGWEAVMHSAAEKYMDVRQTLLFPVQKPQGVQKRHIIGYPVTGHSVREWGGNNGRMPSQLRILVRKNGNKYISYFFHLPHQIPQRWDSSALGSELSVWQGIHKWLDTNCKRVTL